MGILKNKLIVFTLLLTCSTAGKHIASSGNTGVRTYRTVEQLDGEEITVPEEIYTYATLLPSYTETLIDLGLEKNIVLTDARSTYLLEYDHDIKTLDTGKLNINMDVDLITEQHPDIILMDKKTYLKFNTESLEKIKDAGSQIITLPIPKNVDEIRDELAFLVELTQAKHGEGLLANFDAKYLTIQESFSKVEQPIPVFFQIKNSNAITTCGTNVYINELIKLAGGKNVFDDKSGIHYAYHDEIIERNPKYYIATSNDDKYQQKHILSDKRLANVDAIRTNNVYILDYNQTSNPNHRSLDAVLALGEILHSHAY